MNGELVTVIDKEVRGFFVYIYMIFYVLILSGMTCPFALKPVGSLSPAEQCYIARGDI